jgi:hypothetical protein
MIPPVGAVISINSSSARRLLVVDSDPLTGTFRTVWWTHVGLIGKEKGNSVSTRGMLPKTNPNHQTWRVSPAHGDLAPDTITPEDVTIYGDAEIVKVQHVTYYVKGGARARRIP